MSTTTVPRRVAAPAPYVAVQWSTSPAGLTVGTTVTVGEALREGAGERPLGHTPVRTATGVLYVMTVVLREYLPTPAALAAMRTLVAGLDVDTSGFSDARVVQVVASSVYLGVAAFEPTSA